jgi:hypothetical protein
LTPLAFAPDFDDWLGKTNYPEKRKEQLRKEWADLQADPALSRRQKKVSAFIKLETYPEIKNARFILSRSDAFKCICGPWAKAMEEQVYEMKVDGVPSFIKHVPVCDRPKICESMRRPGWECVVGDYSAWECHFKGLLAEVEHVLLDHMLSKFPDIARLLWSTTMTHNHARTKGFNFSFWQRRCSGEMFTSLFNGWTNYCIATYVAKLAGKRCVGFVEGDDSFFLYEGGAPDKKFYDQLGLNVKLTKPPVEFSNFCGMCYCPETLACFREPIKVMVNLGWSESHMGAGPEVRPGLLKSKCLSLAYEARQCPILYPLALRGLELTAGYEHVQHDSWHLVPYDYLLEPYTPDERTRASFHQAYGITPAQQIKLERAVNASGEYLHPELEQFLIAGSCLAGVLAVDKYVCGDEGRFW